MAMAMTGVGIRYTSSRLLQVKRPSSHKEACDSIWFGGNCLKWKKLSSPTRSTQKARLPVQVNATWPSKGHSETKRVESSASSQGLDTEDFNRNSANLTGSCGFDPEHPHRRSQFILTTVCRRQVLAMSMAVALSSKSQPVNAAETEAAPPKKEESTLDSIKSFLDPDELAPSGRKIPKAYKKQVREVVRTLRESLSDQDTKDFRRKADPAKEAIRGYIVNWRGASSVQSEVSYTALERVLRALGAFYSKAGPNARVTDELRQQVFKDLELAENSV